MYHGILAFQKKEKERDVAVLPKMRSFPQT